MELKCIALCAISTAVMCQCVRVPFVNHCKRNAINFAVATL